MLLSDCGFLIESTVLLLLHRGNTSCPQNVYRRVDVSVVVATTFRTYPLPVRKRKFFVVMSAIRTRLRCRRPLSNLTELTIMFETLELQNLNKLPEAKLRHFPAPEAFHALKVQRLGSDKVEPSTQGGGKFPLPIFALGGNLAIHPCELTEATPPIVRTFDFTRKTFVAFAKFCQGVFQELWRLYFLARVQRQKCVLQSEVCTYTFTRSRQHFFRGIIRHDIKPIGSSIVAKSLDVRHIPLPLAMLMEREPAFVEPKFLCVFVPRFEREADTTFFKEITTLKFRRTIFSAFLIFWTPDAGDVKKSFKRNVEASDYRVKCITRYPSLVFFCAFQQLRQVWLQAETPRIFTISTVIAVLKLEKVIVNIAQVVKHIAKTDIFRVFAYLIFIRSAMFLLFFISFFRHRFSRITPLTLEQWVGRHATKQWRCSCLPT